MAKTIPFPGSWESVDNGWDAEGVHDQALWIEVYTRTKWAEEWILRETLIPTEVTWSVAPTLPVAVLEMHYGEVLQPSGLNGGRQFDEVLKSDWTSLVGSFLKVEFRSYVLPEDIANVDGYYRRWYGRIEEVHDEQGGVSNSTGKAYGKLTFVAYGLEKLLADHAILESFCVDNDGNPLTVGIPLDFNRQGPRAIVGNRSAVQSGASYVFGGKPSTNVAWSSYEILDYLLTYQTPVNESGDTVVLFTPRLPIGLPPTNDTPIIKCDNATTYSIISQILDRRRVTMWWVDVDDDTNQCLLKADTMVPSPIIGNKLSLPPNSNQIHLRYDGDSLTNVVINNSELPTVDQVVCQGPRIRCCATFSYDDDNIEKGWTTTQQETYEAGGYPHPDGTPVKRKQTRNDAVRRSPTLEDVYSLFRIPEDWNFYVGNGFGVSANPLFVVDVTDVQPQCFSELFLDQTLPLLEGVDYSDSAIGDGTVPLAYGDNNEMRPFVLFRKPWTESGLYRYQNAEGSAASVETTNPKENPRLSCNMSIPERSRSVRLKVQGDVQHAIAYGDFTGQSEDPKFGRFSWTQALFTLSIESQFRTEGIWPDILYVNDAVRKKVIYCGDQYRQDYVAPDTVVGVDADGKLVTSDGGWIPLKNGDDDPTKLLQDIAKIAHSWYGTQHYVLSLDSYRMKPSGDIPLGSLILTAGGGGAVNPDNPLDPGHLQTINAPVTQITYLFPHNMGDRLQPGRMRIKTWAGELDAVEFAAVKAPILRGRSKRGTQGRFTAAEGVTQP